MYLEPSVQFILFLAINFSFLQQRKHGNEAVPRSDIFQAIRNLHLFAGLLIAELIARYTEHFQRTNGTFKFSN